MNLLILEMLVVIQFQIFSSGSLYKSGKIKLSKTTILAAVLYRCETLRQSERGLKKTA
jgi:hypothetical protein